MNKMSKGKETTEKTRETNMKGRKETRTGKDSQCKMRRDKHWEVFIQIYAPEARTPD